MNMSKESPANALIRTVCLFLSTLLTAAVLVQHASSQQRSSQGSSLALSRPSALVGSATAADKNTPECITAIPPGTILPVRLNSTLSSTKSRKGQPITGRIMQDVPLSPRVKIKEGSKVFGHIVEVTPATSGADARISIQFDKLVSSHQAISITTNLRAIAGFMRIMQAQTPPIGPGESDVYRWLTTVQVGGDVVYGAGGPVTTGDDPNDVVGKSVDGGVLAKVRGREGTSCRGPIDGNDTPQALWMFSSDACGTYGLDHIGIEHAGRTNPTGVIVLVSASGSLNVRSGAGMLLRVNASSPD